MIPLFFILVALLLAFAVFMIVVCALRRRFLERRKSNEP